MVGYKKKNPINVKQNKTKSLKGKERTQGTGETQPALLAKKVLALYRDEDTQPRKEPSEPDEIAHCATCKRTFHTEFEAIYV